MKVSKSQLNRNEKILNDLASVAVYIQVERSNKKNSYDENANFDQE